MNEFFIRREEPSAFEVPNRVYALLIDGASSDFVLFDAVDAHYFDQVYSGDRQMPDRGSWRSHVEQAPIYAIEINASADFSAATEWLKSRPANTLPVWSQIEMIPDDKGEAAVYDNIAGPPRRARISVRPLSNELTQSLARATDLTPEVTAEWGIEQALPTASVDDVFVLDVGQGSANALVAAGKVIAYVDLGAGVLADTGTWPSSMGGICLQHVPPIILTHWHYDHFQAANTYPAAQGMIWIAPLQTLGPGPQSAMARALASTGTLMVWGGGGILSASKLDLERCTGPVGNQNRTGIAVWITGPAGSDPILLPGDAGYRDIPTLAAGKAIAGLVVAHHGGRSPGTPPTRPSAGTPRIALSYGCGNSYRHPLPASITSLRGSHWGIGHPAVGIDERCTEDRPGGKGLTGLGHIRMNWSRNTGPAHTCVPTCGCTLNPTQ